ncbi:dipeptidase [Thermoflavimicrobium dichotomicum]|uniref:Membrane dipeptidase n=1 Tax=Thermoflavimicrobium dichotomicum TaxID=46223 RepID=A0A1I3PTL3_9BACL|nr:dipeptidase [Thermoflavimicrobium dichotomicum]SFJ25134.1 membrane dipeptidase [Thermoflavimicrobium dichotomicum]
MLFFDGHCDVLWKMWMNSEKYIFYEEENPSLDVTYDRLRQGRVYFQTFAIFVPDHVPKLQKLDAALKQIDYFYEQVLDEGKRIKLVTDQEDLLPESPQPRLALLSLEGADALQGELAYLRLFYHLGVRQVGLTWNYANEVADGIGEKRGGGLTEFGHQFVQEMKRLGMVLDVSHLSVRGFWDVIEHYDLPTIASHSNCQAICSHERNLSDNQILALIAKKGLMGITFVPSFVHEMENEARIDHILKHIEHICSLGGEDIICFGSDFDGIDHKIPNLEHAGQVGYLVEALSRYYPEHLIQKWTWENGYSFYKKHLPAKNR